MRIPNTVSCQGYCPMRRKWSVLLDSIIYTNILLENKKANLRKM